MTYDTLWRRLSAVYEPGEAKAIARTLLEELLGLSFADILCGGVEQMDDKEKARIDGAMARLMQHEPLQYVLGYGWFCGRRFGVAPGVLIPRPETEWLVDRAVQAAHDFDGDATKAQPNPDTPRQPHILDIGTGSGCIATSIWLAIEERRHGGASVEAWDISPDALKIAGANARQLGADVRFAQRDILKAAEGDGEARWDIIVSNPPYICDCEKADMADNVVDYEPHTALFVPDDDPLLFYRAIARFALKALHDGGTLLFECNTRYARATCDMLSGMGLADVALSDDCFGMPRFAEARKRLH